MPNIFEFNIGSDFVAKASKAIETFIVEQNRPLRIALSGGSSPKAIYEKLATSDQINWSQIELYLVDERYVPADDNESNAKMIQATLVSRISDLKAFHHFDTTEEIADALDDYEAKLKKLSSPLFDLVLLGLGSDGHTASLFPHGPELEEIERLVVGSISPNGVSERMSLSFPAIMNSQKVIFLIRGKGKRKIVEKWLNDEGLEEEIPAKIILDHQDLDIYFDYSK